MNKVKGVDATTGSLGQGLSIANGMAINSKINHDGYRVYCLLGDGEIEEGQVWEAAMTASHYQLDNLCVIIDNNNLQIDGKIEDVAGLTNIEEKLSVSEIEDAIQSAADKGSIGLINSLAKLFVEDKITLDQAKSQIEEKNVEILNRTIMQLKISQNK